MAKRRFKKKNKWGIFTLPNLKNYPKAIGNKTVWCSLRVDTQRAQKQALTSMVYLFSTRLPSLSRGKKKKVNGGRKLERQSKRMRLDSQLTSDTKMNTEWVRFNIRTKGTNSGVNMYRASRSQIWTWFLNIQHKSTGNTREKRENGVYQDTFKKGKRQSTEE